MITKVKLENFKAHGLLELDELPHIVVLVGQNNTGKSAVLHAAALPKYDQRFDQLVPIGSGRHLIHGGAPQGRVELTYRSPPSTWYLSVGAGGGTSTGWIGSSPGQDPSRRVFYLSALRTATHRFGYERFGRDVGVAGEHAWNILHQLKTNDEPQFPTILDWAKRFALGISAIGLPTVDPGQGEVAPTSYGHRTNIVLHGSGTWSVLPIIVQGVLCEAEETLLIEEPESHLHRAAVDVLWDFFADCAKREVQIICATHSLDLLASMSERIERGKVPEDSALFLFRREADGGTKADRLDPTVFRQIREVIRKELAARGL